MKPARLIVLCAIILLPNEIIAQTIVDGVRIECFVYKTRGFSSYELTVFQPARWIRERADDFGIDENRIAAGGGSAGGYLAAGAAMVKGYDEKDEDLSISSVPRALILYNPDFYSTMETTAKFLNKLGYLTQDKP